MVLLVDGTEIELEPEAAQGLYDELWRVAMEQRGAVTAAARIRHALAYGGRERAPLVFEGDEAAALRVALAAIGAD